MSLRNYPWCASQHTRYAIVCPEDFRPLVVADVPFSSFCRVAYSDNLISYYFDLNNTEVDSVGEEVFKKQLYQCMISQALELKGDIETRRAGNTYGIIVWQYNEIWPTGGKRPPVQSS